MKQLAEGCDEARKRAPGILRSKLNTSARRNCRGHPAVVNLAEVEDEATCEDGRDAEKRVATVSMNGYRWGGRMAYGSMKSVT